MKNTTSARKSLSLSKETVKTMHVRSGVQAGSGPACLTQSKLAPVAGSSGCSIA